MKKKIIALFAAAMVVAALLVGCGSSPKTLQDFVESPEMQEQISELNEQFTSIMTAEMKADGDNLVYIFTYTQESTPEQEAYIAEGLKTSCASSSMKDTYAEIIEEMEKNIPSISNPAVELRYMSKAGSLIYGHVYTKTMDYSIPGA